LGILIESDTHLNAECMMQIVGSRMVSFKYILNVHQVFFGRYEIIQKTVVFCSEFNNTKLYLHFETGVLS
jgi:hypothetical protein